LALSVGQQAMSPPHDVEDAGALVVGGSVGAGAGAGVVVVVAGGTVTGGGAVGVVPDAFERELFVAGVDEDWVATTAIATTKMSTAAPPSQNDHFW